MARHCGVGGMRGALLLLVVLLGGCEAYKVMFACTIYCDLQTSTFFVTLVEGIRKSIKPTDTLRIVQVDPADGVEAIADWLEKELEGFDHLVSVYRVGKPVNLLAPRIPHIKITVIDTDYIPDLPNLQATASREDQMGFVAGVLAGLHTKSGRVAVMGGSGFPFFRRYRNGFATGVRSVCESCIVDGLYCQTLDNTGPEGRRLANLFVSRGADVVFDGATLTSGIYDVADPVFVIGVVADVWYSAFGASNSSKAQHLLGSVVKHVDRAVEHSLGEAIGGNWQSGWKMMDLGLGVIELTPCHASCHNIEGRTQLMLDKALEDLKRGGPTHITFKTGGVTLQTNSSEFFDLKGHFGDEWELSTPMLVGQGRRVVLLGAQAAGWEGGGELAWYGMEEHSIDHVATDAGPSPGSRVHAAAGGVGADGYVFGGRATSTSDTPLGDLWRLSFPCQWGPGLCGSQVTWEAVTARPGEPWPPARYHHAMAEDGGLVYMYAGIGERWQLLRDMWVLNASSLQWRQLTGGRAPGFGRYQHSMVVYRADTPLTLGGVEDTVFVLVYGGRAENVLGDFWAYGVTANDWGLITPVANKAPSPRHGACLAALGPRILLSHGQGDAGGLDDEWVFSPLHWGWEEIPSGGGSPGPFSCVAVPEPPEVVSDPLAPIAAHHKVYMATDTPSTRKGGVFGIRTFPSIVCNDTEGLVLAWSGLLCEVCPEGTVALDGVCMECNAIPADRWTDRMAQSCPKEESTVNVGLLVGALGGALVVVALPVIWFSTSNYRKMRRLLNTNKVATEVAEAVAAMDFAAVTYLHDIKNPTRIQRAFLTIVTNLQYYKAFMPVSLFAQNDELSENEEEAEKRTDSKTSCTGTNSTIGVRLKGDTEVGMGFRKGSFVVFNFRDFHKMLRERSAEAVSRHTAYVNALVDTVKAMRGVPDTFLGDRMLASWNTVTCCATHNSRAAEAALAIVGAVHDVEINAGMDVGKVLAGTCGGKDMRRYTAFGPPVNMAALLCHLNKELGSKVLVSHAAATEIEVLFQMQLLGGVVFRKRAPEMILVWNCLQKNARANEDEWMYQLEQVPGGHQSHNAAMLCLANGDFDGVKNSTADPELLKLAEAKTFPQYTSLALDTAF